MQKLHSRFPLAVLLALALACNFVTNSLPRARLAPTPAPIASGTATVAPGTATALPRPAYIPPGCESAAIATVPPATELAQPTPAIQANPQIDQSTQLHIFDEATKIISDVYVYPNFNGNNWQAIMAEHRAKIAAGISTEQFYSEMQTMVDQLGDNHSRYDSPVDVAESNAELQGTSQYVGIGVLALPEIDKGRVTIAGVFPGSPADHSGLKLHDALLAVDGLPIVQNGTANTYRIRGPECSTERLTVQSPGQAPRDVMVMRHSIQGDLPVMAQLVTTRDGSRIGYIMLPSFFDEKIPGEVADALKSFGNLDGLIIDNRINGGGSSDVVEPVLSYFTGGHLGDFRSRTTARPFTVAPNPIANSQTVPLVVLVGKDTASFGEIFSGILQDSGRAKLVGQNTMGLIEILHGYGFEDGSRLWIAQERFDPAHTHANWSGKGVTPDVQVSAAWDTFTFQSDPAIAAALKLLGHQ